MNIVFAGTPAFALPTLRVLHEASQHTILDVYTQPDRPAGRGRRPKASAVKQLALELGLPILQPERLTAGAVSRLRDSSPDALVIVAYGLILPKAVLGIPHYGCINVHASLLPRWRGAAPIPRAIEAGDPVSGITIMQVEEALDAGDILAQEKIAIEDDDTAQTLHDRLAELGAALLSNTLDKLTAGEIRPEPQDETAACYASKLQKEEAWLDWNESAVVLHRKIRAFNPWPVAHTRWRKRLLRIWEARPVEAAAGAARDATPGTVVATGKDGIRVASGNDIIVIQRLQLEGGKPTTAQAFLNGYSVKPGERLG